MNGWPITPPTLVTVTRRPPLARNAGIAAFVASTTPKKLTSMVSRTADTGSCSIVPTWPAPALLTSTSSRP